MSMDNMREYRVTLHEEPGNAQQGMRCTSCLSEWEDQYKLVGYA